MTILCYHISGSKEYKIDSLCGHTVVLVVPQRWLVHNKLHCREDMRWRGKTLLDITKLLLDSNKGDCFLKSDLLIIPYLLIFRGTYPPHLESVRPFQLAWNPCSNSSRSFLEADMCVVHGREQRCTRPRTTLPMGGDNVAHGRGQRRRSVFEM